MHLLKKYPNRRLYDTTDSQYVTVDDVRLLILSGESIEVVDSKDSSDITRTVLLQILAEQEQEGHGTVLTNRTIEALIRFYGDRFGRIASKYIEEAIQSFLDHQSRYRDNLRQLNAMNPLNMMKQAFDATFQGEPTDDETKSDAPKDPAQSDQP